MKIILTGSPGSGKTTVLRSPELNAHYTIFEEAARIVLSYPNVFGTGAIAQREIERQQVKQWEDSEKSVRIGSIFDRGLPDQIAYAHYNGWEVPDELQERCDKYRYDVVFFFPFWEEIYTQDELRKETPEEAKELSATIKLVYDIQGYRVITVPKGTPQERVNFILSKLK